MIGREKSVGLATYLKCYMSNMANVSQIRQFSSCKDGNFLLMTATEIRYTENIIKINNSPPRSLGTTDTQPSNRFLVYSTFLPGMTYRKSEDMAEL